MRLAFNTMDVFTDRRFGGNPLGVVHDAEGLTDAQMQNIAREFNLSETVFLLPPVNPAHSARVRIFTPAKELPFAGHPTVGTAALLAEMKFAGTTGNGEALIVLDDIAPGADGDATVTAQYQCGFPVSVSSDHRSAAIDGRSSRVALQTFGPQIQLEAAGPIDFGRSWVFAETGVQWHQLKGRYVAKETTPLVTVLLPFTDGQIPQASVSRSSSGLTVRLPGGSSIEFEQSGTGWKLKRS